MADLTESNVYEAGIYQLELTDPVIGGPDGISNRQAVQLANRTAWLKSAMRSGEMSIATAGGTANAITASFTPAISTLTAGMTLYIRAASANTTTSPTFTPNSGVVTAKTIVKGNNLALAAGDIAGDGHWIHLQYDATLDKWVLHNPATFAHFPSSLSTNGYQKLPSGLIIQWGSLNALTAGQSVTITYPIAFPTAGLYRGAQFELTANGSTAVSFAIDPGATPNISFIIRNEGIITSGVSHWIAIGY